MKNFKKAIKTTVLFLIFAALISTLIMEFFFRSETYYYQDYRERDAMAGSIDYVVLGSSHGLRAFRPEILDEQLGVNSYNLCGSLMTMQGKYQILTMEIDRNPIKTVVLEMASSSMTRNRETEGPEGDIYLLGRFSSFAPRMKYFFQSILPKEYSKTYYVFLKRGITCLYKLRTGSLTKNNTKAYKGFAPFIRDYKDITINYKKKFNSQSLNTQLYDWNEIYLNKITDLCKERNIRLILVTTPLSKTTVCRFDNFDVSREYYEKYAKEHDLEFYDFNLLKERNDLFSDLTSFHDRYHLGNTGSQVFTDYYCTLMKKVDAGEDISDHFYGSYKEVDENEFYSKK